VGHLARQVMEHLASKYDTISKRDVLLMQLAGTLHDIGHGPYSHLYDSLTPDNHEERGCNIIRNMSKTIYGITDEEIEFICSVIMGSGSGWKFQIVNNQTSGFDVDKWDYIVRDSRMCGFAGTPSVDFQRFIRNMSIVDGQICYSYKHCYDDIFELFRMRHYLHKKVYNHQAVIGIECTIRDLLKPISASHEFLKMDDHTIYNYPCPLLTRLETRNHYKVIGCVPSHMSERDTEYFIIISRCIGLAPPGFGHPMTKVLFRTNGGVRTIPLTPMNGAPYYECKSWVIQKTDMRPFFKSRYNKTI